MLFFSDVWIAVVMDFMGRVSIPWAAVIPGSFDFAILMTFSTGFSLI
jgi:hypothetical protein